MHGRLDWGGRVEEVESEVWWVGYERRCGAEYEERWVLGKNQARKGAKGFFALVLTGKA